MEAPSLLPGGRVVSIGITPWGIVEKRNELVGKKTDIPFHSVAQPRSGICPQHSLVMGHPESRFFWPEKWPQYWPENRPQVPFG